MINPKGIATVAGKIVGGIIEAIQDGRLNTAEILDLKLSDFVDGKEIEQVKAAASRSADFERNG